jgi:Flp pilus assembly protein TadG
MRTAIGKALRHFARDESGATAVVAALTITAMLGMGAIAIDGSNLYSTKTLLQNAADTAARAAAYYVPSETDVEARAVAIAEQAMPTSRFGTVLVPADVDLGTWNAETETFTETAPASAKAVRVTTRRTVPLSLAHIFGLTSSDVSAVAIAAVTTSGPQFEACVLALGTVYTGLEFSGNVTVNMPNCGLAANSVAADAMNVNGAAASITVLGISVVGGIDANPATIHSTYTPITGAEPIADPYASLPTSMTGLTVRTCSKSKCTGTLEPGRYTNVTLDGDVTLSPGTYYFEGGLHVSGQSYVHGTGVTLAFDDDTQLTGNNVRFDLSAPTSGTYSGIALLGIGANAALNVNAASSTLNGAVYVPQGSIDIGGNGALAGCARIVAEVVQLRGTPTAHSSCSSTTSTPIYAGGETTVGLVH